ncbi:MAG: NrfD/PsrC family molybdoenzyme membrane anchor subunit [Anaerolineales bacterium]
MATEVKTQQKSNGIAWLVGMVVLVVIGAIAWGVQLSKGTSVLGINQIIVWGIYIAAFFALVGLASGLLILAVLSDLGVIKGLEAVRRNLLIGAIASYIAGGFMILMDIGRPERVLNMVFGAQFSSPFVWDFFSLALGVIMAIILLLVSSKAKVVSLIAGIVAGVVVIFEGWILSMSAGSPLWSGGIMPAVFLVEGLLLALGVSIIAKPASTALINWTAVLLPVLFLLNVFEFGALLYAGDTDDRFATGALLSNPLFWLAVVLGIIVPFVLLLVAGKNRIAVITSGVLAVLGVFVSKLLIIVAGQSTTLVLGTGTYSPTIVEYGGVIGMIGLAGLLYLLGTWFLPQKKA